MHVNDIHDIHDCLHIRQHEDKQKKAYFEADLVRTKYCICCFPFPNHKSGSFISPLNAQRLALHLALFSVRVVCVIHFSLLREHHLSK